MSDADNKKISADKDTEKLKIPSRREGKKTFREKISSSLDDLRAEISFKYVATVAGAVFACVVVIGAVLVFADPSVVHLETHSKTATDTETPTAVEEEKRINIKIREGNSTAEIADRLAEKGIIDSSLRFRILARFYGYDDKFRPGAYTFAANMSDDEVFEKLLTGEKKFVRFTVPEGFGVKEIAERLYNLDLVDKDEFLKAAEDFTPYEYMRKRQNVFFAAEGFLFPDTYNVESDMEVGELLELMASTFDSKLTPSMRKRAEGMGLSVYDLITLASLVEREVRFPRRPPDCRAGFVKAA